MKNVFVSLLLAAVVTSATYVAAFAFGWIEGVNWLEALAVFTGYSTVYLCARQSRWNFPINAISVTLLCVFFHTQDLISSAALQIYVFFAILYGWFRWGSDKKPLPVTSLKFDGWLLGYAAITAATYAFCVWVTSRLGATLPLADSAILVLTILAQYLMDNKKLQCWYVWIAVNVVSVCVYWGAPDAKIVALQMALFGCNAVWALYEWNKSYAADARDFDALITLTVEDLDIGDEVAGNA